jgi:hypothetical protein
VPPDPLAAFHARLATGDDEVVQGRGLRRVLHEAARDPGLDTEIGAVRLALRRLLEEEADPARLASGITRLAGVALQIARLRPSPDPALADLQDSFLRALDELEAEHAAEDAASGPIAPPPTEELA